MYLPEYHDFLYIARAPWPNLRPQVDWVDQISTMSDWLDYYVGPHHKVWAWTTEQEHQTWEACVAFKLAKHKTFFLLTWT